MPFVKFKIIFSHCFLVQMVTVGLLSIGCSVTPQVLTETQIKTRVAHDIQNHTKDQEPLNKTIDLFEAMVRSLRYNLDTKVEV